MVRAIYYLSWVFPVLSLEQLVLANSQSVIDLSAEDLKDGIDNQLFDAIIDVRTQAEWNDGHIPTATLVADLGSLRFPPFPPLIDNSCNGANKVIVLYCRSGARAGAVAQKLIKEGYTATIYNGGGTNDWIDAGLDLVRTESVVPSCSRIIDLDAEDLKAGIDTQLFDAVIDVRTQEEWNDGHIPTATFVANLGLLDFPPFPPLMDRSCDRENKAIVLYCRSGARSGAAAQRLIEEGYRATIYNGGGINDWVEAGLDLVQTESVVPSCSAKMCINDRAFSIPESKTKNCVWIMKKEKRRKKWCSKSLDAREFCPTTCGICCIDDKKFNFQDNNENKRNCKWLKRGKNTIKKQKRYCVRDTVRAYCPITCDFCQDYVSWAPTISPN